MKTSIAMISAKQGGGKTTLAQEIQKAVLASGKRIPVKELIFAGPIYEMHDACRKILVDAGVDPIHEVKDGYLLQMLGTEWGRNTISEDVWVRVIQGRMKRFADIVAESNSEGGIAVIPDLRFENEFHAFPDALRVRLECPEEVRKERVMKTSMWRNTTNHPSETSLDLFAARGKFDLYFDSENQPSEEIACHVLEALDRNDWLSRR